MTNYRFTILLRQYYSRYYIADIMSWVIYLACLPNSDERLSFFKLNVME